MKARFIVILIFICICLTVFVSCDMFQGDNGNVTSEKEEAAFSAYLDSDFLVATVDNLEIELVYYHEYELLNMDLSLEFIVVNNQNENIQARFDNIHIIRESTGSSYEYKFPASVEIKAGLKERIDLDFELPTSIHDDNYYLEFSMNGNILRFYLYNTPDELRELHTVSYVIDGVIVHEEQVLHGKSIPRYEWYSQDHQYYCISWSNSYVDGNTGLLYTNVQVKENITLDGRKKKILKFMSLSSDKYAFAQGLNEDGFVPPDKTIVIPDKDNGKPVRISNYFFSSNFKDVEIVYIPNTDKIYSQYFSKTKIHTIHFAGSKDEWEKLGVDVPSYVKIYYNSKFNEP